MKSRIDNKCINCNMGIIKILKNSLKYVFLAPKKFLSQQFSSAVQYKLTCLFYIIISAQTRVPGNAISTIIFL